VDQARFPRGIRAISDHAHARGVKTILWFEPERVTPNTKLYEKKQWLLGKDGEQKLLNMGNPEARRWVTDRISSLLTSEALDLYRQDFNIDPLPYWRENDAPDRQGITEIRYVEGYLTHLDELLRRHPGLRIDTCASGGRRNDLETLRRATPNLRSDYILEPLGQQQHTYGISLWIPFHGTGVNSPDPYIFRSQMCPHLTPVFDMRDRKLDYESIRKRIAEWQAIAPLYYADYYPLTPYATTPDAWLAWEFQDPKTGKGFVQAFRRPDCKMDSLKVKLRGLDPSRNYQLTDVDSGKVQELGKDLQVEIKLPGKPAAALITYTSR
jgi:alpha-galactosidase